ncbi:hypothetical protein [Sphingosinicella sp. CPCC 101087]|uniref:hypothetical protein n=1 Tax=Sphingosinicella sp. CPCC 101087 TaxID=2497754 RepID=UPI00101D67A8|nr:hypothetical protein [Sphingosinicella sp. CPCC 101087]
MKTFVAVAAAGLLAGCMNQEPVELSADAQAELASELEGRTAGAPVPCVNQRDIRGNRSVGEGVLLFDGPSDIVYVNRPAGGCPSLDYGRALRTRTTSTRLCRGDIAVVFDPTTGMEYGGCGLGDFVPYRRAG